MLLKQTYRKKINITAPVSEIWKALTDTEQMQKWMLEEKLKIITNWEIGSTFIIQGTNHWVYFENKGKVLAYEPMKFLSYNYLSSLSRLPDTPENQTIIEFNLEPHEKHIVLSLVLRNFPTESIYKHVVFYWNSTLIILKKHIENHYQYYIV
ncbi:SRPBCC family protein [Aurantibacillus circumpalustris]|uniref:SRPBCC family protein n=1 Tax=Aurantibacillus circumpalustris TaxID=3036359 RepID=UPI00295B40CF|nr:SRPBCC domain-containing protein [Aurantibacillus circumpalustris]